MNPCQHHDVRTRCELLRVRGRSMIEYAMVSRCHTCGAALLIEREKDRPPKKKAPADQGERRGEKTERGADLTPSPAGGKHFRVILGGRQP
jgi:hypothetical protein